MYLYNIQTNVDNYKYTENPLKKYIKNEERIAYFVVQTTKLVGDCESLKATGCSHSVAVLCLWTVYVHLYIKVNIKL